MYISLFTFYESVEPRESEKRRVDELIPRNLRTQNTIYGWLHVSSHNMKRINSSHRIFMGEQARASASDHVNQFARYEAGEDPLHGGADISHRNCRRPARSGFPQEHRDYGNP